MLKNEQVALPHYERINFLRDFNNLGYVKKVLCLYKEHPHRDTVYYNNRETTEIPCVENEFLILSNYDKGFSTYTMVQTDFSLPSKYKVLMIRNDEDSSNPKMELYKFVRDKELVKIKKGSPVQKKPQIDYGYGNMLAELLKELSELNQKEISYHESELYELCVRNIEMSKKFAEYKNSFNFERTARTRFCYYLERTFHLIFQHSKIKELTILEVFDYVEKYQENYRLNL